LGAGAFGNFNNCAGCSGDSRKRITGSATRTRTRSGNGARWAAAKTYLHPMRPSIAFNLVDGVIRMSFFPDHDIQLFIAERPRRVFEYHGAEHKTVFTWEAGLPLTVANARPQPRQHPRCAPAF